MFYEKDQYYSIIKSKIYDGEEGYHKVIFNHGNELVFKDNDFECLFCSNDNLIFGIAINFLSEYRNISRYEWEDNKCLVLKDDDIFIKEGNEYKKFVLTLEDVKAKDWYHFDNGKNARGKDRDSHFLCL